MAGQHARLSASAAHRWMTCAGSVGGADSPNIHAATGTLAHDIAAEALRGRNPRAFIGGKKVIDGFEVQVDQEMIDHVNFYADTIDEDRRPNDVWWIELPLLDVLQTVDKDFGGTADYVRYRNGELWTVDFKYGSGVYVEVVDNRQLRMYALGALLKVLREQGLKVERVKSTVIQPRYEGAEPVRSEEFAAVDLLDFAADLREAAERTRQPNPPLVAGNHCTFCPKRRTCLELERHHHAVVAANDVALVPLAALGSLLQSWKLAQQRGKALEEHAYTLACQGQEIPGYKLVEKIARRKWKREGDVIEWAQAQAINPYAPREILSPAQLEERLRATAPRGKKKEAGAVLEQFVERVSSGTALVPVEDSRPAAKRVAESDFAVIDGAAKPAEPVANLFLK